MNAYTEQEVTIPVHQRQPDAESVGAQRIDNYAIERVLRIIYAVVTWPGFKEIAENVEILGGTCAAPAEKIKKTLRDARCLRRKVQV